MLDYTPRNLRFDRPGVDWIKCYAKELRSGIWPGGLSTEYLDSTAGSGKSSRAPFENPCLVIAELEIRIKHCGLDGFLVEEEMNGKDVEEIARERCLDIDYISRRINKVLGYCASGRFGRWFDRCRKCKQPLDAPGYCKRCSPHLKEGEILGIRKGQTYEEWQRRWNWNRYSPKEKVGFPAKTP